MRDITPRKPSELRISQLKIIDEIVDHPEFMVGADMGIGKTAAALIAMRRLLDRGSVRRWLVVAPLLVAESTWPDEIELWEETAVLEYEVLTGPPDRREQRALRLPEVTIINRENIGWLADFWASKGVEWPYDGVALDEMSSYKNPTKRNKPTTKVVEEATARILREMPKGLDDLKQAEKLATGLSKVKGQLTRFGTLCKIRAHVDHIFGLSGTMAPNGMTDIWSQYFLLDQGARLYTSMTKYKQRWFDSDYMGRKFWLKEGAFPQIVERIQDITISMRTEDFTDMPDITYLTRKVTLPPKVMKQYKELERTLMLEEHDIEAVNKGVLTGKLLQLANGSVYDEDGEVIEIHDLKLDVLADLIDEAMGEPVFVAYSYKFDLIKLKKRFPTAEVVGEAKDVVKRWNNKEIKLLLAHPQSAGHGLNLQFGGYITVWYGLCWSLEYYQQFNKRLHRPGQVRKVFIYHIVATGTKDEDVMEVLPMKEAVQDALIEATIWRPARQEGIELRIKPAADTDEDDEYEDLL